MAIVLRGSVSNGLSDQTTRTLSYNVLAGDNRCILVGVTAQNESSADFIPGTPTFGGQNMTQEGQQYNGSGIRSHLWMGYILETDIITGIMDFSCTFNQEMNRSVVIIAQFDNVKQSDDQPFANASPSSTNGFGNSFSVNVTTGDATELVVDVWGDSRADTTAMSTGPGQTLIRQSSTSVHSGISTYEAGTGSPVNMQHSAPATVSYCGMANSLVEAVPITFLPRMTFFFSLAGLAIPAAIGKILSPTMEQVKAYGT